MFSQTVVVREVETVAPGGKSEQSEPGLFLPQEATGPNPLSGRSFNLLVLETHGKIFLHFHGTQAVTCLFSMQLLSFGALFALPARIVECEEAL